MRTATRRLLLFGGARPGAPPPPIPPASLFAFWDAERPNLITTSGGLVSSFRDTVGGYNLVQSSASLKPVYSATSFSGRPGLTFDGVDDNLALASVPASFPVGASPCELWVVADQQRAGATTGNPNIFGYGGSSSSGSSTSRVLRRTVVAGVNRAWVNVGTGAGTAQQTNSSVDFSGRHVLRGQITGTLESVDVDAVAGAPAAAVPATTSATVYMNTTETLLGVVSACLVTAPLSAGDAAALYVYLNKRLA